jgi:hypothetical protein
VTIETDPLLHDILRRIIKSSPYYRRAEDLLDGLEITQPPEMIAFPDSAELAGEVREMIDARVNIEMSEWWPWQNIRDQLASCCWLVSGRGITFTPYIPASPSGACT